MIKLMIGQTNKRNSSRIELKGLALKKNSSKILKSKLKKEKIFICRVLNVASNIASHIYYICEHIAWLADNKIINLDSGLYWLISVLCWLVSLFASLVCNVISLRLMLNEHSKKK